MANYTPTEAISPSVGRGVFRPDWFPPPPTLMSVRSCCIFIPVRTSLIPPHTPPPPTIRPPNPRHVFDVRSFCPVIGFCRKLIFLFFLFLKVKHKPLHLSKQYDVFIIYWCAVFCNARGEQKYWLWLICSMWL